MYKKIIVALTLFYFRYELPMWGKLYNFLVGDWKSNDRWRGVAPRIVKNKIHGLYFIAELGEWSDRSAFFLGRWYDDKLLMVLDRCVKPGDVVVDVGANYGHFTMAASAKVGSEGVVVAYEPNPAAFARLSVHCSINCLSNVDFRNEALGEKQETLTLTVPRVNSGEASLCGSPYLQSKCFEHEVTVSVGDKDVGVKPNFIKVDVEGFELFVLKGFVKTLEENRPFVVTEVVSKHLARSNTTVDDLMNVMEAADYVPHMIESQGSSFRRRLKLTPLKMDKPLETHSELNMDLLWVPKERVDLILK